MDRFLKCKSKTPRDEEYISAYLETHSQTKAAQKCGVSRETIARAVRRADIELTGNKYNHSPEKNGGHGNGCKITDKQILEECAKHSFKEVAAKYNISLERLWKRARKCGAKFYGCGNIWSWRARAERYGVVFDSTISLPKLRERDKDICQICGKPVDDKCFVGKHVGKWYPTLDHIVPLSKGGTHTWGNVQLAHMSCNAGKCDKLTYTVKREGV